MTAKSRTAPIDQTSETRAQMRQYWLDRFTRDEIREMAQAFAFVGIDQEPFEGELCPQCRKPFEPKSPAQVYCKASCARDANREIERVKRPLAHQQRKAA